MCIYIFLKGTFSLFKENVNCPAKNTVLGSSLDNFKGDIVFLPK